MSISTPFIQRPIATSLLMAGLLLVGIVAFPLLPVAPLPQIDFPTIQITTQLPGASPETMASSVSTPLEKPVRRDSGRVADELHEHAGHEPDHVAVRSRPRNRRGCADVQAAIDAAGGKLPHNLPAPPVYKKVNPADSPILILAVHSDVLPLTEVDDIAENRSRSRSRASPAFRR